MPTALLYHDVTPREQDDSSGFLGPGAAHYKLTPEEFRRHLEALAGTVVGPPLRPLELLASPELPAAWVLTFDDGGASAFAPTADLLEAKGWRGHFFIPTDFIDSPAFMTRQQLRDLHQRGHDIGSHSCRHPERLSSCTWDQLVHEWGQSRLVLEDILGAPVNSASVPGGFYSQAVARAAAHVGLKVLFNSEPTVRAFDIEGCRIVGRYSIVRGTSAQTAAALVRGARLPRLRQSVTWNLKRIAKASGGRMYLRLREWLLGRAYRDDGGSASRRY